MNVPNHEKKAFRDMTPEERSAIVEAFLRGDVEVMAPNMESWIAVKNWFSISPENTYRTRPRQLVIPWEHIKPEYKWAAMDEYEGNLYFYKVKPELSMESWNGGVVGLASALNIDTAGIDWRESLTARPEGV